MKSGSKTHEFFLGKQGDIRMPLAAILLVFTPFLIAGLCLSNRKYNALSANPIFTSTIVSEVYRIGNNGPTIKYWFTIDGKSYQGSGSAHGLVVGDRVEVVYQKDKPANNMTVFQYYEGPPYGAVAIYIIIAIALAVYRWRRINCKSSS